MDFLVCQRDAIRDSEFHIPLENMKDQDEAVSKARDIANDFKEGDTVGLFTQDGVAICGWKVLSGGKLRNEPADIIQDKCRVYPGSFDFAKRNSDAL